MTDKWVPKMGERIVHFCISDGADGVQETRGEFRPDPVPLLEEAMWLLVQVSPSVQRVKELAEKITDAYPEASEKKWSITNLSKDKPLDYEVKGGEAMSEGDTMKVDSVSVERPVEDASGGNLTRVKVVFVWSIYRLPFASILVPLVEAGNYRIGDRWKAEVLNEGAILLTKQAKEDP